MSDFNKKRTLGSFFKDQEIQLFFWIVFGWIFVLNFF